MPRRDQEPPGRAEIEQALDQIGQLEDHAINLAGTALLLAARDRPEAPVERYREHLDELAQALRGTTPASAHDAAMLLGRVMTDRFGYDGDRLTYDDPQNANLMRVIDRRKGLPVALGILYLHTAQAAGWRIDGLAFPGHFLLGLDLRGEQLVLDPFNGGRPLDSLELERLAKQFGGPDQELTPALTRDVGKRDILLRLQNNLKARAMADGELERASALVRDMLRVAPTQGGLWLEYGQLEARLGHLASAARGLENCVEHSLDGFLTIEAQRLLDSLRRRLN